MNKVSIETKRTGTTAVGRMRVNDVAFDYTEDPRRRPRPCVGCGEMTRGRVDWEGGEPFEVHCLKCAMTKALGATLAPLKDAMRGLLG